MKNDSERGLVGAWARRSRMAAGLSVEQAVARLAAEGTAADASYVRAIVVLVAAGGLAAFIAHQVTHPALGR